ncbi:MAG TPA: S41 family peptidase [Bacteroidia bacterium]|jgi:carboxyl-terminal processing protease|nr:S41 family peptidase [Bacteroidia bacterium]
MKKVLFLFCVLSNAIFAQTKYQKDFSEFWNDVNENYAYLKKQKIDWNKVKELYQPAVDAVKDDNEFIRLLEHALNELYNGHSSLNTNLPSSNRLTPSGTDMYIENDNNHFIVKDLRKGFGAEQSGIKVGMEIVKFNDLEILPQLKQFLPTFTKAYNAQMLQYATDMLFAGTHDKPRKITVLENGAQKEYYPDKVDHPATTKLIESKIIDGKAGYIKVNNCLYNYDMIAEFDKAVDQFSALKTIIIDISETPSGGNTTVARAMMGRFIKGKLPYQNHEIDEAQYETKQIWTEYVIPRKKIFTGDVIVIVGHWTGSMGEGIAIGFDAINRGTVVGTKMAGLIGAINGFKLSETHIGFQIPTEELFHINGTPREDYLPKVLTKNGEDTWLQVNSMIK